MKKKGTQYMPREKIAEARTMTPEMILSFIDDYQHMVHGVDRKRKLISLRVPENILEQFKFKARKKNLSYQKQIVELMRAWVST